MQRSSAYEREPCPLRVFGDCGGGFALGLVGGTLWHGIKGSWQAPKGNKLNASLLNIGKRAPRTAKAFGIWGGTFSIFDCLLQRIRRREDVWNPIMAGTMVGFLLPMRRGLKPMLIGAVGGFVILAAIESLQLWFQGKVVHDQSKMAPVGLPPGLDMKDFQQQQ